MRYHPPPLAACVCIKSGDIVRRTTSDDDERGDADFAGRAGTDGPRGIAPPELTEAFVRHTGLRALTLHRGSTPQRSEGSEPAAR